MKRFKCLTAPSFQISPVLPGTNRGGDPADVHRAEPSLPQAVDAQNGAVDPESLHPEAAKVSADASPDPGDQGLNKEQEEQVPQALGSGVAEFGR